MLTAPYADLLKWQIPINKLLTVRKIHNLEKQERRRDDCHYSIITKRTCLVKKFDFSVKTPPPTVSIEDETARTVGPTHPHKETTCTQHLTADS